jgi:ankyrin repeat protein
LSRKSTWPTEPSPQVSDPQPSRSLAAAIRRGDLEAARKIVHSGAKLNIRDEYQSFPLSEASALGDTDFVEELLKAGADPNLDSGATLQQAAWKRRAGVARALLAHGAEVNAAGVNSETALILSSQTCADGVMVQVRLDAKANPNAGAKGGGTALMAAARNPVVAEVLLNAGADPAAKNDYGDTAESESCDRGAEGFYRVCQLVRAALAKAAVKK